MFDKKTGSEVTDFPGKYVFSHSGKSYVVVNGECCMFMVTHIKGIIFSIENSVISLQEIQSKNKWLMKRCENIELMGPLKDTGREKAPRLVCRSPPTATASFTLDLVKLLWGIPSFGT